jgi:hypothetical protein
LVLCDLNIYFQLNAQSENNGTDDQNDVWSDITELFLTLRFYSYALTASGGKALFHAIASFYISLVEFGLLVLTEMSAKIQRVAVKGQT